MTKKKKKRAKKAEIVKERDCEDWCFICKDGGDLMLCDYEDCLKVYHPHCVVKDGSGAEPEEHWTCDWHSCFSCQKPSQFYCYCCPNAVCKRCIDTAEFAPVKGRKGLCSDCLDLVMIVEEKVDLETEEGKIDLEDRNTFECLFLEYWDIIKEEEGLTLDDIYEADDRMLKGRNSNNLKSKKNRKRKKDDIYLIPSDTDSESDDDSEDGERISKKKGSNGFEFIGWGSKPLIEFLTFLGKDTTEELSQIDVELIINQYIREKKLFDPRKRKRIHCDERLYSLFRKEFIQRNQISKLLEAHLIENLGDSEKDEDEIGLLDKNGKMVPAQKKQKTVSTGANSPEMEADYEIQESCFASIIPENIKHVYLRKSLVEELLNEPESFDGKVVGSFVKVKNDCRDDTRRNSYQLLQVLGIKKKSTSGDKSEILLRLSNMSTDVNISMLSDSDFCEDEIDDLRQKVEKGSLPKFTVVELEKKAKHLHVDITKHWIEKELVRLQKLINYANEKGWRRELYEYLEQIELLKKPTEQERLIQQPPKVIAEIIRVKVGSPEILEVDSESED